MICTPFPSTLSWVADEVGTSKLKQNDMADSVCTATKTAKHLEFRTTRPSTWLKRTGGCVEVAHLAAPMRGEETTNPRIKYKNQCKLIKATPNYTIQLVDWNVMRTTLNDTDWLKDACNAIGMLYLLPGSNFHDAFRCYVMRSSSNKDSSSVNCYWRSRSCLPLSLCSNNLIFSLSPVWKCRRGFWFPQLRCLHRTVSIHGTNI